MLSRGTFYFAKIPEVFIYIKLDKSFQLCFLTYFHIGLFADIEVFKDSEGLFIGIVKITLNICNIIGSNNFGG